MEKDLGIKLGNEKTVFWTRVKNVAIQDIKDAENSILFNKEIIIIADKKILEEKDLNN